MNDYSQLQQFIDENIPLVGKAGFQIEELTPEKARLSGKKEKNRNHHGSVFGGSISAALILTGWLLVREIFQKIDPEAHIVVASQSTDFLKPCRKDFFAEAVMDEEFAISSMQATYEEKGKLRISLKADLYEIHGKEACAIFSGQFYVRKS